MIALVAACVLPGLLFWAAGVAGFVLTRRFVSRASDPPRWARVVAYGASALLCLHALWLSVAGIAYLAAS